MTYTSRNNLSWELSSTQLLSRRDHFTKILNTCSSSTYALRVLRNRNRNRRLEICTALTKTKPREQAYAQALIQNKSDRQWDEIDRQWDLRSHCLQPMQ